MSDIHAGMNLPSTSKEADRNLYDIVKDIGKVLSEEYGVKLLHKRTLSNAELIESIGETGKHVLESKRSGIKPDGGVLMVEIECNGRLQRMPVVISENKKQGDGKDQAKGNAVERLGKNVLFCQTLMRAEEIMPFIAFCYGEDFRRGSTIIDRVRPIAQYGPANTINVYKDNYNQGGVTWFHKVKPFCGQEMYQAVYAVAEKALKYYLEKYEVL